MFGRPIAMNMFKWKIVTNVRVNDQHSIRMVT